jgi:hypothetical protein
MPTNAAIRHRLAHGGPASGKPYNSLEYDNLLAAFIEPFTSYFFQTI